MLVWISGQPGQEGSRMHFTRSTLLTVDTPTQEEWKLRYLTSLLGQLQVAKQLVQEENINHIQGLIDSLVI